MHKSLQQSCSRRFSFWSIALICLTLLSTGCNTQPPPLSTGYGKFRGNRHADSVNGTRVLKGMLEDRGVQVDRYDKLSPRIDRYEAIVWFQADFTTPSPEAIERIELWLENGWEREFIFVGRDFTAAEVYWANQLDKAASEEEIRRLRRERASAIVEQDLDHQDRGFAWGPITVPMGGAPIGACDWFETVPHGFQKANDLSGDLANGVTSEDTSVYYDRLWQFPNGSSDHYDPEPLLVVDGQAFAYAISNEYFYGGNVVLVSNGSFLLNYQLVNSENRLLAGNLLDRISHNSRVLFLESGGGIPIRNSEYESHNQWAWITNPPLRYIVPHFLFWGILFAFVYFPIFGRPKRVKQKSKTDFHDHVSAIGRLIERADSEAVAKSWIATYQKRTSGGQRRKSQT